MSVMLVTVALSMLFYAQFYNAYLAARYSWGFDFLYCLITPFCAPLYYVFVNCLTDIKPRPALNVAAFLPAVIYGVLLISAQTLLNSTERHTYICNEIQGQNIQLEASVAYSWMVMVGKTIFGVFMPVQSILVVLYGEFRLNTYTKMLERYSTSSYMPGKTIKMRGIHFLTILIVVTGLIMSSIPMSESTDHIMLVAIAVTGQVIMVSLIVSFVMRLELSAMDMHGVINDEPEVQVQPVVRTAPSVMVPAEPRVPYVSKEEQKPSTLMEKIDYVMHNDNLFLRPDLSLVTLCEMVGTNRTYASRAIKNAKGCSFPDYVNRLRLEYAVEIMRNTPKGDLVIQNVAVQCGCGSIQTFYRYFRAFYGVTPSQWVERNK